RYEQRPRPRTAVGEFEHHDEACPARDWIALAREQTTAWHGPSRRRLWLKRRRVRTEVNEVRDAFPEAVTAVDRHLASAAIGSLDLPQRHVDGQAGALQHPDGLGQRLENLVTPVARWRQSVWGDDRAIWIEDVGEKRASPRLSNATVASSSRENFPSAPADPVGLISARRRAFMRVRRLRGVRSGPNAAE